MAEGKSILFLGSEGYSSPWKIDHSGESVICDNCTQTAPGVSISVNDEYWCFVCTGCLLTKLEIDKS